MKYENFKKAKETVEEIDKHKKTLEYLSMDNVAIEVMNGAFRLMTIGAWSSCEHGCKKHAVNFVHDLKVHYETKLEELFNTLETL